MWETIIPIAANVLASSMGPGRAERAASRLVENIANIPTPTLAELNYSPELLEYLRDLELEQLTPAYTLGPSAFEAISLDPDLRQKQLLALAQAQQRALEGFTAEDRAALEQYLQAAAAEAQSGRKQIMEDMARRGMSDSGAALIAALQGSQNVANMLSNQALQRAALSLQQKQQASDQLARLASNLEQTDYSRATDLASRRDAIEQFNQQLRQKALESNVEARRKAQLYNLEKAYEIDRARKEEINRQRQRDVDAAKWRAQFELSKATGQAQPGLEAINIGTRERSGQAQNIASLGLGLFDWLNKKGGTGNPSPAPLGGSELGSFPIPGI